MYIYIFICIDTHVDRHVDISCRWNVCIVVLNLTFLWQEKPNY